MIVKHLTISKSFIFKRAKNLTFVECKFTKGIYRFHQARNITFKNCKFLCDSFESLFKESWHLERVVFDNCDTSRVKNMSKMFDGHTSLVSVDLRGIDTSNVTDMHKMFYDCNSLKQ